MVIVAPAKELRDKLGDAGVDALVELVNKAGEGQKEDIVVFVEEKFEKRLAEVKSELKTEIERLRTELKIEMADTRSELKVEIARAKSELLKWMFIFWVGQVGVITGILLAFFK